MQHVGVTHLQINKEEEEGVEIEPVLDSILRRYYLGDWMKYV